MFAPLLPLCLTCRLAGHVQMVGVTLVLYGMRAGATDLAEKAIVLGLPLLGLAAAITLASLVDYFRQLWAAL